MTEQESDVLRVQQLQEEIRKDSNLSTSSLNLKKPPDFEIIMSALSIIEWYFQTPLD